MYELVDLLSSSKRDFTKGDINLIEKAYNFSKNAHSLHKRLSGEPYFNHSFETAKNIAIWGMDANTITAGLLHDVLEDTDTKSDDLEKEFGSEVLCLVDGVTKLGTLRYSGAERHIESLRKFFMATADDVRVLIIKLADRLHNIKTLDAHPKKDKRERIALETIELYAPLAYRLGMGEVKGELEDYAFPYIYPKEYKEVIELFKQKKKRDSIYIKKVHRSLQKLLAKNNIKYISIGDRIKHIYSLYKKLKRNNMNIDNIHDIVALRVIVDSIEDCYKVLGIIHETWKPVPEKIKDYIARPKTNGYKSLHTTIFTGDGGIVEIQIRTKEMHDTSEFGIASHIKYKEEKNGFSRTVSETLSWLARINKQNKDYESKEYLKNIKGEFYDSSIFVFTPKGDVLELPEGGSVLDFAYAIHSDIGNHATGARVNGKFVSLNKKLENGNIVEIDTKKTNHPTRKWLDYVMTDLAKRQIRSYLYKNIK